MKTSINKITISTRSRDERHGDGFNEGKMVFDRDAIEAKCDSKGVFEIKMKYPPEMGGKESVMQLKVMENSVEVKFRKYNTERGRFDEVKTVPIGDIASFDDILFIYDMSAYHSVMVE